MMKGNEAKKIFSEDDELYQYGMNLLIDELANISVAVVLGVLSGRWLEIVFFVLSFVSLRRYAGGYHCKTSKGCFWMSSLIMAVAVAGIVLLQTLTSRIPGVLPWICLWESVMGICILMLVPIEAKNKPLDSIEKKVYGKRARITMIIQMAAAFLLLVLQTRFGAVLIVTHSIILITLLIAKCLQHVHKA